ncbi:hypothetical protein ABTE27_22715, partial [Acinetobacter baumannii]
MRNLSGAFSGLGQAIETNDPVAIHAAVDALSADAGITPPDAQLAPDRRLGDALIAIGAADAMRSACNSGTD